MFILYDILYLLFILFYFPIFLLKKKWHKDIPLRFGKWPKDLLTQAKEKNNIWIHAVSVGEVLAVRDLVSQFKKEHPNRNIVFSTVTFTGNKVARDCFKDIATIIYFPLDLSWIVKKFVRIINPKLFICVETEIWPNLYSSLEKNNIPILLINGRISDKGFKGYSRIRFFLKNILLAVSSFCMRSQEDADRIVALGAKPERVKVVGNIKFDCLTEAKSFDKRTLGFDFQDKLFIAGSTHYNEEDIIIQTYQKLAAEFKELRLIIAPRHIERVDDIVGLINERGFNPIKLSEVKRNQINQKSILVVDKIGVLRDLYSAAEIVFIGKSFAVGGGQNMIEPAALGKATFVGPRVENFTEVVELFLKEKALVQVLTPEELTQKIREMLKNPSDLQKLGQNAKRTVEESKGATGRTLKEISRFI